MSQPTEDPINRRAWDRIAEAEDKWFVAVSAEEIERARSGDWSIKLTPVIDIPREWLGEIAGKKVLCLAGAGGRQAPILAAAGASVTVADFSAGQLKRDMEIADRFGLSIEPVLADMRRLNGLQRESFDLIVNPTSVCYISDVQPVWDECARLLKHCGELIAGFMLPGNFLFDPIARDRGRLELRYMIPYSDFDLPPEDQERVLSPERPVEYGHSMQSLIGGQLAAGFQLTGFFSDRWGDFDPVSDVIDVFAATRAMKISDRY